MADRPPRIPKNAVGPYALRHVVNMRDPRTLELVYDGTAVTGGEFVFRRGSSLVDETWVAIITSQTTEQVILSHVFAPGDVPNEERIRTIAILDTPDGPIYSSVAIFDVVDKFNL